ncbi:Uncharacterized protein YKL187C [Sugiyamaella lignohabitans]|uniref:Uncharacterized protein YKL187C n=1 Tax=Sugiyamaella lignohabitans TaxID=796027 RepID=A0A167DYT7_9ASCO|nr:Uncharacterized protein YKL187C [Sugiyamaella lignohabitans]ANB13453.1 Uncharacterized protein YKL187C [Sugiyamaella lignohabitans]
MVGSLVALVLALVVFLGSYEHATGLKSIYFMRIDLSNISASAVQGIPSDIAAAVDQQIPNIMQTLGISDFYDAGTNGYCQGTDNTTGQVITECFTPHMPFWFDFVSILENNTNTGIQINLPSEVKDYEKVLHAASVGMWVCYVVGIVVSALAVVSGIFAICSRFAACCASIISVVAFLALLLASALATGIFVTYRKEFNNQLDSFGAVASLNGGTYVLTWVSVAASLWAAFWWFVAMCCGKSSRRREVYQEEKQPFIGYVPHQGPF